VIIFEPLLTLTKSCFETDGAVATLNLAIFTYKEFHGFWQAKFPDDGSVLGSSQFSILPQLSQKKLLNLKVVKIDQKNYLSWLI